MDGRRADFMLSTNLTFLSLEQELVLRTLLFAHQLGGDYLLMRWGILGQRGHQISGKYSVRLFDVQIPQLTHK